MTARQDAGGHVQADPRRVPLALAAALMTRRGAFHPRLIVAFHARRAGVERPVSSSPQAHRVLGIGIEHVVLLDSKTLVLAKSQHTSELQQWRAGGGRSHDRLVLEFRGTKWSFVAAQSLRSISSVLWEIMQDLDARFLDEHLITTREELDKGQRATPTQ
ncbi:hypothetical protein V5799_025398 [Amblyomma americanum]|uniref:Uncharacterized protein n=1 Tax=Amblyomma americanum TaxID=6943 RepID=A0AAQ4E9D0_AMBAM